jgi:hypothetical protein
MEINKVIWTKNINKLIIKCDCENIIKHPMNISLVECDKCDKKQWYAKEFEAFNDKFFCTDTMKNNLIN